MNPTPKIQIERDDDGFHALVIDTTTDRVLHITNTYAASFAATQAAKDWLRKADPMTEKKIRCDASENESCPRFIAFVSDSYVESDDDLEALITIVKKDGAGTGEDCVIWDDFHTVAAVIRSDGSVHKFKPPVPAAEPVKPTTNGQSLKRFHPAGKRAK